MSDPHNSSSPRYHVVKRRAGSFGACYDGLGSLAVFHTCSSRCCLEVLNRLGVAPGEHVYTGGGEWEDWIWTYLDEPSFPDYRVHCDYCGRVLHDPDDPSESLFGRLKPSSADPAWSGGELR